MTITDAAVGALAPIKALLDDGARITLCTDTKSADMFETMRMAISVVHSASASNVRHVFCDGVPLGAGGWPTQCDAADVVRAAQQAADRLWARARGTATMPT